MIMRAGLLLVAVAVGCAGDDATTSPIVTAEVVTPADSVDTVDADEPPLPDVSDDDVPTVPDVEAPADVPDADGPDADSTELPDTDLPDSPDVGPDPVDVSDTPQPVDSGDLLEIGDSDVEDSEIDDSEIDDSEIDDSEEPDVPPDPGDTMDVPDVVEPPTPLVLGTLAGATFTPLADGIDLEITQGPQGGIHLEVGIDVTWDSAETKLSGVLSCRTRLGAKDVGFNETPNFILYRTPDGTYRSVMIPVYFQDWDAAVYVNQNVAVSCTFTIGDVPLEDGAVVHLIDLF